MPTHLAVTFVTPHQRPTSGGVHVIQEFARLAPEWVFATLVVAKGETRAIEGVEVVGPERLDRLDVELLPREGT